MNATIHIFDRDSADILKPELLDVLAEIPDGPRYNWQLVWLNGAGQITHWWPGGILALEKHLADMGTMAIPWRQLIRVAKTMRYIDEVQCVGFRGEDRVWIALHDSSYWLVEAPPATVTKMEQVFQDVRRLAST